MPTVNIILLDARITFGQKRELAESMTKIVSETLGSPKEEVTIVFKVISRGDIARGGRLGRS